MNSHLVSRTLLKRFANKGLVRVTSLVTGENELKKLRDIAYLKVSEELFYKLERKWGNIESSATTAFNALDQGTLLKSTSQKEAIKRLMTLHYVRSQAFVDIMVRDEPHYFQKLIQNVKADVPDKANYIESNLPTIRHNWLVDLAKMIPGIFRTNSEKVENYVKSFDIEIGMAPKGVEFILGDNPALTVAEDGRIGIRSGVPINEGIGFAMPLGPRHIAALITHNPTVDYRELTSDEVEITNNKIKTQCIKEYYSSPLN